MKNFFVSYNSADRAWAEWIAWELEQAGFTTVIQAWDFRPGSNFVLDMQRAASDAERTIAVLSPNYLSALYTQPEWAAAFAQDPTGEKGTLLPIRVRECELKGLLSPIVYIDLVGLDDNAARARLIAGVPRERAKPKTAPAFPTSARDAAVIAPKRFPGALPPIWNVPHNRNPNFTGREDLLKELRDALTSHKTAALAGLGGVGKTQLAVEYAYRYASEYDLVWWIRSEELATLAADYARLAQDLDLREKDAQDQRIVIEAVKKELRQRKDWLLIFDYATDEASVYDYLPQGDGGNVIITSRNPVWKRITTPLSVKVMLRDDAIDFLLKRTSSTDRDAANKLADALGDLALALEQAGAFIEQTETSLANYLAMFSAHRAELLQQDKPLDYPDSVMTTWNISFEQAGKETAAAPALMNLLAFFAPDDIPRDVIMTWCKGETTSPLHDAAADEMEWLKAETALLKFSLIQKDDETISVHRLVQAVARDRMSDDAKKQWAETAAKIVDDAFPNDSDDVGTWNECSRLLTHALAAAENASILGILPEPPGRLFNQAAIYLKTRAQFSEARNLCERALTINENALGQNHPQVASCLSNLGLVLTDLGDLDGARKNYERALAIDEAAFGPNHRNVARDVNNLGLVLRDLGDFDGARKNLERAIRIFEDNLGANDPQVATTVNNLGMVLQDLGDLDGARKNYERALAIDENALGQNHLQVAYAVNNLGLVLRDLGDFDGARKNLERAIKIFEDNLGANHPQVATTVNNLGMVLKALGDLDGARKNLERALTIDEATFGPNHPQVARDVNNLGGVLLDFGDFDGARKNFERALAIDKAAFGPSHPNVARDINNLGEVLQALGDLDGARKNLERALTIDEAVFGPNHPNVAVDVNNLGEVLQALGDLDGARKNLERALTIDEAAFGPSHPNVAIRLNNIGMVLHDLGDLDGARKNMERALTIDEAAFGPNHPNVARDVSNLGSVLQALGDLDGARINLERALAIDEAAFGLNHPSVANRLNDLGNVLYALGDLDGARINLERALKILTDVLGDNHPNTIQVRENLEALEQEIKKKNTK